MSNLTPEIRYTQAKALKDDANELVRQGQKGDALSKYEKGIRFLGFPSGELDEEGVATLEALTHDNRELLSILASNAAQMYMDPSEKNIAKAMERCTMALEANPYNAKAYFRRATCALERAGNIAKGVDAMLAEGQSDVRRFLQFDPENKAGLCLQEKLSHKRQVMMGPILRQARQADALVEPDWYQEIKSRAIFICMCGSSAVGRDQLYLPDALLSMAMQAKDKKAVTVGVAYVGYRGPDELEMFDEQWQKKYYRMLKLGERATKVPEPRQVEVHGEVYNVWSLLEGRVRVMRVAEFRRNGEKVGTGWMRYCSQLLWHGEPFVYQTCRTYQRFAPKWDEHMKLDLAMALRRTQNRPVISWVGQRHEEEPWQWISEFVDHDDNIKVPPGTYVATEFDNVCGFVKFRRRYFSHMFGMPPQVAFFNAHSAFSTSEILTEVPADPFLNSLPLNGQMTCENVRLYSHGWNVYAPCCNLTWESNHDTTSVARKLQGDAVLDNAEPHPHFVQTQSERANSVTSAGKMAFSALDDETLDLPLPTGFFWTAVCPPSETAPWETGRRVGNRFVSGNQRNTQFWEQHAGVDLVRGEVSERARNGGFNGDRDFEDARAVIEERWEGFNRSRGRT